VSQARDSGGGVPWRRRGCSTAGQSKGETLSYLILKVDEGLAMYDAKSRLDGLDGRVRLCFKNVVGEGSLFSPCV